MKDFVLFRLGVTDAMDPEMGRVTILSNAVYVIIGSILVFYIALRLPFYLNAVELSFSGFVPIIILVTSMLCLLLNRAKLYILSKSLFISTWILFTSVLLIVMNGSIHTDYIIHPFYCIVSSVMVHLLFSYHRERIMYIVFLLITWSLILFSVDLITYFMDSTSTSTLFRNGFVGWRISTFMFAVFFNSTMIYVLRLNQRFYNSLQARNETITLQNQRLEEQRHSLEVLMYRLEEKVASRTLVLREQNKRLTDYAFFNSHILRAPVSRIRGLLNLLTMKIDVEEEQKVRVLLSASMNELDLAIKSINEKLDEVNTTEPENTN
jgi:signal transduction histidine kinase